jgi:hypothetical protein
VLLDSFNGVTAENFQNPNLIPMLSIPKQHLRWWWQT